MNYLETPPLSDHYFYLKKLCNGFICCLTILYLNLFYFSHINIFLFPNFGACVVYSSTAIWLRFSWELYFIFSQESKVIKSAI